MIPHDEQFMHELGKTADRYKQKVMEAAGKLNPPPSSWEQRLRQNAIQRVGKYDAIDLEDAIAICRDAIAQEITRAREEERLRIIAFIQKEIAGNKERGYNIEGAMPGILEKLATLTPSAEGEDTASRG